jgi:hypothetical protein
LNPAGAPVEHYITLFDNNFLPMGLCLHGSLLRHGGAFVLWVLCMDEAVERNLRALDLPHVRLIPLAEAETAELRAVKPSRSRGEYCWTLTPFTPDFVFAHDAAAARVTYIDADLFFFATPAPLFAELEAAAKDVLITEHAFAPEYESAALNGRFCVQFITFRRTPAAATVMRWWQARCIEWCYGRHEDGRFGDQKYLDQWPGLFGDAVHILQDRDQALAPWNADYRLGMHAAGAAYRPAFYHFHGLRVIAPRRLKLFGGHRVRVARPLYAEYVLAMRTAAAQLQAAGIALPFIAETPEPLHWLRNLKRRAAGRIGYAAL